MTRQEKERERERTSLKVELFMNYLRVGVGQYGFDVNKTRKKRKTETKNTEKINEKGKKSSTIRFSRLHMSVRRFHCDVDAFCFFFPFFFTPLDEICFHRFFY